MIIIPKGNISIFMFPSSLGRKKKKTDFNLGVIDSEQNILKSNRVSA